MGMVEAALAGTVSASFACWVWGVRHVFVVRGTELRRVLVIAGAVPAAVLAVLLAIAANAPLPAPRAAAGLAMALAALALFGAAARAIRARPLSRAFCDDAPEHVTRAGPYRWVRHPFYTSYMLTFMAGLVATAEPLLVPVVLGMVALYALTARHEEGKFAGSALAADYEAYRAQTGMFLPNPFKRGPKAEPRPTGSGGAT